MWAKGNGNWVVSVLIVSSHSRVNHASFFNEQIPYLFFLGKTLASLATLVYFP